MKYQHANWFFPIWINPDFDEMKEIAALKWDTLRVLETDDGKCDLIIADGYGHTHSSTVQMYAAMLKLRRYLIPTMSDVIIHHIRGQAYMNPCGFGSADECVVASRWDNYLAKQNVYLIEQLCILRGLKLKREQ